ITRAGIWSGLRSTCDDIEASSFDECWVLTADSGRFGSATTMPAPLAPDKWDTPPPNEVRSRTRSSGRCGLWLPRGRRCWIGHWDECRTLRLPRRCRNKRVAYGYNRLDLAPFSGGYGEFLYPSSPETTFILKIDAPASVAVLSEPLGVAASAVRKAQPKLGDTIVVQGSGAIGLLTLGMAKLAGATRAIVVGGPAERLEQARAFGADVTID